MTLLEPNRGLYRAIAPSVLGQRYQDSTTGIAYNQTTPTLFESDAYTIGVLFRPIYQGSELDGGLAAFDEQLLRLNPVSTSGFVLKRSPGGTDVRKAKYTGQVGTTQRAQNDAFIGAVAADPEGNSEQEGLILSIMVVDNTAYPEDLWLLNGQRQDTVHQSGWNDVGAVTGNNFELGFACPQHIVGMFFHEQPMTYEECMALQWNVQTAKDIPDTDPSGLGTVPHHIWSVKRAMEVGTTGVASWVSDGSTGGETLSRVDTGLTVVEFDSQLATAV